MGFLECLTKTEQKDKFNLKDKFKTANATSNSLALAENDFQPFIEANSFNGEQNPIYSPEYVNATLALNHPMRFIAKYLNESTIENAIKNNSNIKRILKSEKLEVKFDIQNVKDIIMSHLIPTAKRAQDIYTKMGHTKKEPTYAYLTQAALLHDIGKVFIPREILNKKGRLTPKERSIIELHNKLSYEILKTTDLNPQAAILAYEHHNYEGNLKKNHENQALTIADVYSALRESRPYKKPISHIGAKTILYDMGTKGQLDTRYVSYVN
ncbi:MAG: HD domain-containing protein [Candidatus Gastranaerophilales bacterium]|nr:HD domain-containing protein [Candidatus Gastranaerophilales bacterium]